VRVLLDTHILLWWLNAHPALSKSYRAVIADRTHAVYVSAASLWEISIKSNQGKLDVSASTIAALVEQQGFLPLAIDYNHVVTAGGLPLYHKDPFDRLLIAQAHVEALMILSVDEIFRHYDVILLASVG